MEIPRLALGDACHDPVCLCSLDRQVRTCLVTEPAGDLYRGIADATRRRILDELSERDGQTLFELCTRLAMKHGLSSTRQAISQHLDVLEDVGLVRTRREGRYKFHHLDTKPLREIVERWSISEGGRRR